MSTGFDDANSIGKQCEAYVKRYLTDRGITVEDFSDVPEWRAVDTDFRITNKQGQTATLEVKSDTNPHKTGNFLFELGFYRTTGYYKGWFDKCQADYLCFVDGIGKRGYILDYRKVKEEIQHYCFYKQYWVRRDNCFGDGCFVAICHARKAGWIVHQWDFEENYYEEDR